MLLESEDGVYSDLDTAALKPIDEWVPLELKSTVLAVVGIEYDQGEGEAYAGMEGSQLQFCQRTLAASRGHPLMSCVIMDVVEAPRALASNNKDTTIAELRPNGDEITQISRSAIWTRAVLMTLSAATGKEMSWRNFTEMKEPGIFGGVMALPVDRFGNGQLHSRSGREGSEDSFVKHG